MRMEASRMAAGAARWRRSFKKKLAGMKKKAAE
jgi:hypothetical protein